MNYKLTVKYIGMKFQALCGSKISWLFIFSEIHFIFNFKQQNSDSIHIILLSILYEPFSMYVPLPGSVITSLSSFPVNVWEKSICEDDEKRQHNESHSRLSTLSLLNVSCSNNLLHFHIFV